MVPLLVIGTIVALVLVDLGIRRFSKQAPVTLAAPSFAAMTPDSVLPPGGLFLDKRNTWLRLMNNGHVRVGGTALVLQALGRVSAVELPNEGAEVKAGEPLFTVRAGKRSAVFRAPVDGVVTRVNAAAEATPEELAQQAFAGWLVEMDAEELAPSLAKLSVAEQAVNLVRRQYDRFKDMLMGLTAEPAMGAAQLADGGAPVMGALQQVDDETSDRILAELLS